jgi:CBS domain-containing protein
MPSFDTVCARDVMTKAVIHVRPDQPLFEAERTMIQSRVSGLPVVSQNRLVGILTTSDIARVQVLMAALDGQVSDAITESHTDGFQHTDESQFQGFRQRLGQLRVKDAMRDQVVTCSVEMPVAKIAARMVQDHIHRVVVVDGERPVGIVSSLDLVKLLAG